MKTRIVMTASAVALAIFGIACTFAPQELLAFIGAAPTGILPAVIQILSALLLGFAFANWMAKDSLIGGIYNRALAIGNLVHFTIGAITLAKLALSGNTSMFVVVPAVVYVAFAIAFASIVFGSPVKAPA